MGGCLSYFVMYKKSPRKGLWFKKMKHAKLVGFSYANYVDNKNERKPTSSSCNFVGGNLVIWKIKKQTAVSRSIVEAGNRVMAHTTCELIWLKNLFWICNPFTPSKV